MSKREDRRRSSSGVGKEADGDNTATLEIYNDEEGGEENDLKVVLMEQ
jgi:hypothetical protein